MTRSPSHASPFVHNVADLRRPSATKRSISLEAPVDWRVELSEVLASPPLVAELELHPTSGGIIARGTVAYTARHTCHRCLDQWEEDVTIDVTALFADEVLEDEDDYELSGELLDLEQMLRDEVLLALPLLPTCPEECRGLVTHGQSDLNTDAPGDEGGPGSPFAVLKDLFPPAD